MFKIIAYYIQTICVYIHTHTYYIVITMEQVKVSTFSNIYLVLSL